ncbi:uncharacterized protein KGF55_000792 [Candida pseudojiufengensis]|uniref:uncharacterized protein n=1 Tax=Candida pseudojiufengensis TaxID=497109 RepID=UPI0022240243|nr:uncharacterized protein KGF55_000792 [Candida pseudojiufengensis]KAI5966483.1 hypothetical protein KGF55_000792 [Candida pseudojiufengensis]
MVAAKRLWIKLKLPSKFLGTLPKFEPFVSKSRLKKIAQEERRIAAGLQSSTNSQKSSPAPDGGSVTPAPNASTSGGGGSGSGGISQYKINVGLKESSTAGLAMNSINSALYALDKSGKPCKKWVKKQKQFKTFTGFKVNYSGYVPSNSTNPLKITIRKPDASKSKSNGKAAGSPIKVEVTS